MAASGFLRHSRKQCYTPAPSYSLVFPLLGTLGGRWHCSHSKGEETEAQKHLKQ